jgi:hypothetical protein
MAKSPYRKLLWFTFNFNLIYLVFYFEDSINKINSDLHNKKIKLTFRFIQEKILFISNKYYC